MSEIIGQHNADKPDQNPYEEFEDRLKSWGDRWRRRPTIHWRADAIQLGILCAAAIYAGITYRLLGANYAQSKLTEDAAIQARNSAASAERTLILLNRAFLTTSDWSVELREPNTAGQPPNLVILFKVVNPGKTPAKIESIEWFTASGKRSFSVGELLTEHETFQAPIVVPTDQVSDSPRMSNIQGRITYTDIFRRTRHRRFGRIVLCVQRACRFQAGWITDWNIDEEWDQP
jgi:hypothetical protein